MAKDEWILSTEHPEEKIINMIKAKSNLNLNMHEPINNIPESTIRYGLNRTRRNFGDKSATFDKPISVKRDSFQTSFDKPSVKRDSFPTTKRSSVLGRAESFNLPPLPSKTDGLTIRREMLEMKHHSRMSVQGSDSPVKLSRDRGNNSSSPSSADFDSKYSKSRLQHQKKRTSIPDVSYSELSDTRKNSLDEEVSRLSSARTSRSSYLPLKYPDDITKRTEGNRKVKRSNSHYVPSFTKPDITQERRRSDELLTSARSLPYWYEGKQEEKKPSYIERLKKKFTPNSKKKKTELESEKLSTISQRYKGNPGVSQKNTKLKRTASYSDSESSYRRPTSNSTKHLDEKQGYSMYGESEEESMRRGEKYPGRDEVDNRSDTDSGIRHWKNDVYLHSSAVGDIPVNQFTAQKNGMRETQSREDLSLSRASLSSPVRKTLSRSLSVLSPWTPRSKKYSNDINYNYDSVNVTKPPKSPSKKYNSIGVDHHNHGKKMDGEMKNKTQGYGKPKYSSETLPKLRRERNENSPDNFDSTKNKLKFVGKLGGHATSKTHVNKSPENMSSTKYAMSNRRRKTFNSESSLESDF